MITQFFEKFWKEKKIKKWNFLYKKEEHDTNIYLLKKGKILLTIDNIDIAIIWEGEISGEKSFLNQTWKPINAKALTDIEVKYISPEIFNNLSYEDRIFFLKQITLFISDRVYLLNDIINNISYINNYINQKKPRLEISYLKDLFKNILEIQDMFVYKLLDWAVLPIFESKLNLEYRNTVEPTETNIVISNKDIFINLGTYLIIINFSELKKSRYVVENTLIHSTNNLKYLSEKLEELKNNQLEALLE